MEQFILEDDVTPVLHGTKSFPCDADIQASNEAHESLHVVE